MTSIPRDQQSTYPGGEYTAPAPTIPDNQTDTSAISARGPPTSTAVELWSRETVLKYFGGDRPLHVSTLYRGVNDGTYPKPLTVGSGRSSNNSSAVRWLADECRAALARMITKRDEPRVKPTGRGRKRRITDND